MKELITDLEKHVQLYKDLTPEHHLDFTKWLKRSKNGSLAVMPEHICEAFILWAERAQPDHLETSEKANLHNILYAHLCESYKTVLARFEKRAAFFETLERYVAHWNPRISEDKQEFLALLKNLKLTEPSVVIICNKLISCAEAKFKGNELFVLDEDKDELFIHGLHKLLGQFISAEFPPAEKHSPDFFRKSPDLSPGAMLKERISPKDVALRMTPGFLRTKG